jgi:hypothetical protein
MTPAGQPTNENLEARHFAELRREPAMDSARAKTGWRRDMFEPLAQLDQVAMTPKAYFDDIKIDASHRVLVPPTSDSLAGRLGLIAGALIASGLTWLMITTLPSPFAPTPVDRPVSLASSADVPDSRKGDYLKIPNAIIRKPDQAVRHEMSVGVALPTPSQRQTSTETQRQATGYATKMPRDAMSIKARVRKTVKLAPAPETRPTTIEGWKLRDVTNGTAVLEGPSGTWRVVRGDTVPGLGRVDSIFQWGNRLMVATSKGLVSTP